MHGSLFFESVANLGAFIDLVHLPLEHQLRMYNIVLKEASRRVSQVSFFFFSP